MPRVAQTLHPKSWYVLAARSALPIQLEQGNPGRYRYIERRDAPLERNPNQEVASLRHLRSQTSALASQHERRAARIIHAVVLGWSPGREAIQPKTGFLEFIQRAPEVLYADHGKRLQGSGGGLCRSLGETR